MAVIVKIYFLNIFKRWTFLTGLAFCITVFKKCFARASAPVCRIANLSREPNCNIKSSIRSFACLVVRIAAIGLTSPSVNSIIGLIFNIPPRMATAAGRSCTLCLQTGTTTEQNLADYFKGVPPFQLVAKVGDLKSDVVDNSACSGLDFVDIFRLKQFDYTRTTADHRKTESRIQPGSQLLKLAHIVRDGE